MKSRRIIRESLLVAILSLSVILAPVMSAEQRGLSGAMVSSTLWAGLPPAPPPPVVIANLTSDNSYALYYGNATGATTCVGTRSCDLPIIGQEGGNPEKSTGGAGCIATGQQYVIERLNCDSYIYVVAWSDKAVAQGLLASFTGPGGQVLSGGVGWKVFPTNTNLGANGAPCSSGFMTALNNKIAGSTSSNWVNPAIGNVNGTPSPYPVTATGFPAGSRWMWHKKSSCTGPKSPFQPGCDHGEYLVFRLPARNLLECLNAQVGNICCMGGNAQGQPIYTFSFVVNNSSSSPASVTITSPTNTTLSSFVPQSVPPGTSTVTGTFTWLLPPNTLPTKPPKFCFVVTLKTKGGVVSTKEICFSPPCGPGVDNPDKGNPDRSNR